MRSRQRARSLRESSKVGDVGAAIFVTLCSVGKNHGIEKIRVDLRVNGAGTQSETITMEPVGSFGPGVTPVLTHAVVRIIEELIETAGEGRQIKDIVLDLTTAQIEINWSELPKGSLSAGKLP